MCSMPQNKSERLVALADQCVQCGLCLPTCPTYALDGNETESPRGRIAIASALARGLIPVPEQVREPVDHCLGCLKCERVCPAQVRFGELLVDTRALLGPSPGHPRVLLATVKRPAWLRVLARLTRWMDIPRWHRRLVARLPASSPWRAALGLMAAMSRPAHLSWLSPGHASSAGEPVALFPGCVASVEDEAAQHAAISLLRAVGHTVVPLPAFCCGALDAHGGESHAAERAKERVREAWRASGATRLVTITPGCVGQLRAALPDVPVTDPFPLLAARAARLSFRPSDQHVVLHVPCTQLNVTRSEQDLLALLQSVPGLAVTCLPARCCGAAGSHMLEFPERAALLRTPSLDAIESVAPDALLSSNIGCRLHLGAGLAERDHALPTLHPMVLLAQQLVQGSPP